MAKIVKKKRRLRIEGIATVFFIVSAMLYLGSALFLKSYNVTLSKSLTIKENELGEREEAIEETRIAVKELENRDRILGVAESDGIAPNQNNVQILNGESE